MASVMRGAVGSAVLRGWVAGAVAVEAADAEAGVGVARWCGGCAGCSVQAVSEASTIGAIHRMARGFGRMVGFPGDG